MDIEKSAKTHFDEIHADLAEDEAQRMIGVERLRCYTMRETYWSDLPRVLGEGPQAITRRISLGIIVDICSILALGKPVLGHGSLIPGDPIKPRTSIPCTHPRLRWGLPGLAPGLHGCIVPGLSPRLNARRFCRLTWPNTAF